MGRLPITMCAFTMCACTFIMAYFLFPVHFAFYFHSTFHSAFLHSSFHSCPRDYPDKLLGGWIWLPLIMLLHNLRDETRLTVRFHVGGKPWEIPPKSCPQCKPISVLLWPTTLPITIKPWCGSLQSLDWTGGLDWWTGLVDWTGGLV